MDLPTLLNGWTAGNGPLYQRLADAIREQIASGALTAGDRLPAERELARVLTVSRSTVVAAYADLGERLLDRRQGSGTYVRGARSTAEGPRERRFANRLDQNLAFRWLLGPVGDLLDLRAAHVFGHDDLPDEAFTLGGADLAALRHGHGYLPWGVPALRAALATHQTSRGLPTAPEHLLVTSGAQQAIALVAALCVQPGEVVVLEELTHPGAVDVFAAAGARLLTVPVGDAERLEAMLRRVRPRLVFMVPSVHNPTGEVMGAPARERIARIAAAHDVLIVEDNTLADLSFTKTVPPPIAAFADGAGIVTIGSLSKLCWGGLRIGWVTGPPQFVHALARAKTIADLGTTVVSQVIAARLLARVDEIARSRRRALRRRCAHLEAALAARLPEWRWRSPAGGLCLWLRLPAGTSGEFVQFAARHGVALAPGTVCSPEGGYADHLRLPFGHPPEVLEDAVERLAAAWRDYTRMLDSALYTDDGVVV